MKRRVMFLLPLLLVAGCGDFRNPFVADKPFVPTAVPGDFAIVVDENHDTFVGRRHIQQVITAADGKSRTTYTTYRDFNDAVSERFTQETTLTAAQLQAMWNCVASGRMMEGGGLRINWLSDTDLHQKDSYIIQIRANEQTRTYQQTNGFTGSVRPLMMLVGAVRLPAGQSEAVPVVGGTMPASAPASVPATGPVAP